MALKHPQLRMSGFERVDVEPGLQGIRTWRFRVLEVGLVPSWQDREPLRRGFSAPSSFGTCSVAPRMLDCLEEFACEFPLKKGSSLSKKYRSKTPSWGQRQQQYRPATTSAETCAAAGSWSAVCHARTPKNRRPHPDLNI